MKNLVRAALPEIALRAYRAARVVYGARRLARAAQHTHEPETLVALAFNHNDFRPLQVRPEITALLRLVAPGRPATVLEIGSALGGTAFLFARIASPRATLVLVDRAFGRARRAAIRRLALPGQRVFCLRGDSRDPATIARVWDLLDGAPVDFLFIDGDHSYTGVTSDFREYSSLVREGGLIALHDIVPDHRRRFGRQTPNDSGEVFRLWLELRSRYGSAATELIENPDQDGFGIGVLRWRHDWPPHG